MGRSLIGFIKPVRVPVEQRGKGVRGGRREGRDMWRSRGVSSWERWERWGRRRAGRCWCAGIAPRGPSRGGGGAARMQACTQKSSSSGAVGEVVSEPPITGVVL